MDTILYKDIIKNINKHKLNEKFISSHYPQITQFLKNYPSNLTFIEKLYWFVNDIEERPLCYCGRPTKFRSFTYGYNGCCSSFCSNHNPYKAQKTMATKLEKYGSTKYNNREKRKQTCISKYGVDNPFRMDSVKKQIVETNILKYGVQYAMMSDDIKTKTIQNNIKKYGVEHPQSLMEVKEKIKKTNQYKYINNHDYLIRYDENGDWVCKCPHKDCNKCDNKEYTIEMKQFFARREFNIEPCTKLLSIQKSRGSNTWLEQFVKNILDNNHIKYVENDRSIIYPYELDIYIPSHKIAIECNGCFWHSDEKKSSNYHYDKFNNCLKQGIQLLSIWEDQIINTPSIVESLILSKVGLYKTRIYARKCKIKEISSKICSDFLFHNHIQGKTKTKVRLGLYYGEELVGVMTFNKRSKISGGKNDDCWELNRFCTKLHTQVLGGAQKLLSYFISNYHPNKVVSFSSNDISVGALYHKLGFLKSIMTKSYWYVHKKTYIRYHRTSFQKSKIKQYAISDNESEKDIMMRLPYYRIYDAGHTKWEKTF